MCSIFGIFGLQPGDDLQALRRQALECSQRQRHRGPDWSGVYVDTGAILVHERLAIVDPAGGSQPLLSEDGQLALAVNGEIYNHRELKAELLHPYAFQTGSDCEVINALYREDAPASYLNRLNGIFAFALWDKTEGRVIIARDPIGVVPLYWGHDREGRLRVASELKSLVDDCADAAQFPPGHWYDSATGVLSRYYERAWREYAEVEGVQVQLQELREAFERAVHRQLMTDVPYGVLLSGGLDSSLVAAVASRYARHRVEENDTTEAWWPRLHSFAIGLKGSPDLAAAEVAAAALGTVHHGFEYTFEEGLDALPDVIRHIETYDVTTIRASTPMFLLARRIKAMGVKMVLSGEGSDEIFGGYLYFHKAPNAREFHEELVRKLEALSNYDCLRANKSMMAWGVEPRVPFLDREFLDVAMRMDASFKMIDKTSSGATRMEKGVLREAFAGYLPESILWRQKEQFSDGVGYGWIDGLKAHAAAQVSDRELAAADRRYPVNPPQTKEAYFYRTLFEQFFPSQAAAETVPGGKSIACSSPTAIAWDASFAAMADPSGRAIAGVHEQALAS
ncbi:asparagine synthetase B [Xanthomonas vasicola pv. vasculorum NCPPB 895]|uniref:asparagine synthase (glutamine-hydrolyzing) n=3 Tax=Xanthomonas vasicola TaxID=56459 RepID=A0A836P0V3_XANVA|nr:asparagine synthase B [Xanthomonas vasicola]KEZ95709.1 asparagine synthetase B [Xanthomonas vasicola pv. vasculorum NCPPB 895]MBV6744720.1 asparagine synthase B [Xanthomonas vasicola pv. vasculorum NCPPB 890]MBV6890564.1 asparagine synthase B [Xanthomonas vasicola pv. vasculorum]MBV7305523.1 asparagine synthase B [Xanthomonas vasicola pv. vasculorum]MDO6934755.1 asparagine synthase B [Xanthomonas vasicola]